MTGPRPLHDRVALVTGASVGIGAATARALAAAGARVVLAARTGSELDALASLIDREQECSGTALAVPTDVTDPDDHLDLRDRILAAHGRLDIVVANAAGGGHPPTPLAEVPVEVFDSAIATNLRGTFLTLRHTIPTMIATGGGSIVVMGSSAGSQGVAGLTGYCTSKHALVGLTRTAALDHAADGIRINLLAPGPVLTHHLERAGEQARSRAAAAIPLGRVGTVEDVADAVVWLCSDGAGYVTGTVLPLDGGKLAGTPPFDRPATWMPTDAGGES